MDLNIAEVAQLVEHQPSKLRAAGSNPVFRSTAEVAQWQSKPAKTGRDAIGSIPAFGSKNNP